MSLQALLEAISIQVYTSQNPHIDIWEQKKYKVKPGHNSKQKTHKIPFFITCLTSIACKTWALIKQIKIHKIPFFLPPINHPHITTNIFQIA